jgi:hypothetical protein
MELKRLSKGGRESEELSFHTGESAQSPGEEISVERRREVLGNLLLFLMRAILWLE